jgi:hypothetical protein
MVEEEKAEGEEFSNLQLASRNKDNLNAGRQVSMDADRYGAILCKDYIRSTLKLCIAMRPRSVTLVQANFQRVERIKRIHRGF